MKLKTKSKIRRLYMFILALLLVAPCITTSGAAADSGGDLDTLAPYFLVESEDPAFDGFPLKETEVTANINGVIADIYVVQTYANDGTQPINAKYVFPAGTRAAIHGMTIQIGDTVVAARIKEKEEAKQVFETAKSEGKSAALLEQQRPNVFTMSIANVMPGDVVKVELHYTELVVSTEGVYEFVFPTVVGPRYAGSTAEWADAWLATPYLKDGATPSGKYNITVNLAAGVPVSDPTCESHETETARESDSAVRVTLADPEDYAGNRDFILNYKLAGQKVNSGLLLHSGEKENFFLLMVQPPERVELADILPREYIFVLDVSGSMYGYPLDNAKILIKGLLSSLRDTDKFNLILFSGASYKMSPTSLPATAANINRAITIISNENGGGGTELLPAIKEATVIPEEKNFSRSIVVITDGYISGEKELFDYISQNNNKANFFSFGIGSSVNRYLIEGVAKAGLGESFVVTEDSGTLGASVATKRFYEYVQSPVLTDIHVTYEGFDVYDVEPLSLPDLFAARPIILYGKWRGTPSGEIQVTGRTGSGEYSQTVSVTGTEPSETNSAIGYLWARSKLERITDYGNNAGDEGIRKTVTEIGLEYSMMTQYTSFVAVVDVVRNTEKKSTDIDQPLPLPLGVSNYAVGYMMGSEPEGLILVAAIPVVLVLGAMVSFLRKRKAAREDA